MAARVSFSWLSKVVGAALALLASAAPSLAQQNPFDPAWFPRQPPLPGDVRLQPPAGRADLVTPDQVLNSAFLLPYVTGNGAGGPPDPSSACGPRGILSISNTTVSYCAKNGNPYYSVLRSTFFGPNQVPDSYVDPRVLYDPQSARFFVMTLEVPLCDPNGPPPPPSSTFHAYVRIAVSLNDHPTHVTDWMQRTFDVTKVENAGSGESHYAPDYPGMAVDATCLTVTANYFEMPLPCRLSQHGVGIITFSKVALLAGTAAPLITWSDGLGEFALSPVSDLWGGLGGSTTYFVEWPSGVSNALRVWALSDPLRARTLSFTTIVIPDHGFASPNMGVPQCPHSSGATADLRSWAGTAQGIAQWADGSIWFCGTGTVGGLRTRVHYYRLALDGFPAGTPVLQEAGVIDGGADVWNFSPSIAPSPTGALGIVFTQSSATMCPRMMAALRPAGATAFLDPVAVASSPEFYGDFDAALDLIKWGDYAAVSVDPIDGSFWMAHMAGTTDQIYPPSGALPRNRQWLGNLMFDDLSSGWPASGRLVRRGQTAVENLKLTSDGQAGVFAYWTDERSTGAGTVDDRVLRIGNAGDIAPGWTTNGTFDGKSSSQCQGAILPDGAGGAFVVRGYGANLFVDRRSANGQSPWPGQVQVGTGITSYRAAADGASGVILSCARSGQGISVQRVTTAGVLAWSPPPIVSSLSAPSEIAPDGAGGAFVSWTSSGHVFVKRVLGTGFVDPSWPANGVDLGPSALSKLVQDGTGGLFVVYFRSTDLYAVRLTSAGATAPGWTGGKSLVVAAGAQFEHVAAGDGAGGLLVAWTDGRDVATTDNDIYVTRLDANGERAAGWAADGTRVCGAIGAQRRPALAEDGAGGALVTWIDARATPDCTGPGCGEDVYWSRVLATGSVDPSFPADGKPVSVAPGDQADPLIVRPGTGTAFVAWLDGSLVPDGDPAWVTQVLAQRLDYDVTLAAPPPVLVDGLSRPEPNPAGEFARVFASLAQTHPGGRVAVDVFDITGRLVRKLYSGPAVAGRTAIVWDLKSAAGAAMHSGLYFIRLTSPSGVFTRGVVVR